jgi:hypothetical protein
VGGLHGVFCFLLAFRMLLGLNFAICLYCWLGFSTASMDGTALF